VRVLFALVIGIILGAVGLWYISNHDTADRVQNAANQVENAAKSAGNTLQQKLRILDLRTNDFKDELARTGRIVRRKAGEAGKAIADATADARTTAAIKAKFLGDHDLSVLSISVNTTSGIVTLSGTVPTPEAISKAMLVAMETDGVQEVISTLQVKPKG
jgi:osmotically-inducible protein OsmY